MSRPNNSVLVSCEICGTQFHISISRILRNKSKRCLCSRLCYYTSITINTREKPGEYFHEEKGRWYVFWRDNGKRVIMSRAAWRWEQANGPVPDGYVVHHKDDNKKNDDLDNLEIMTRAEHAAYHQFMDAVDEAIIVYHEGNHERDNSGNVQEVWEEVLDKPGDSPMV